MQLSAHIGEAGHEIESIELNVIDFQDGSIVSSHLSVNAKVNGITEADFQELVTKAEKNCPISKLLNTKITSEAVLA
jgi:osmotically inducible protein OsmC